MKTCTQCGERKPLESFQREPSRNRYTSACKACIAAGKAKYWEKQRQKQEAARFAAAIGQPPCDGCFRRERCAVQPVPCWRFDVYVETGKAA